MSVRVAGFLELLLFALCVVIGCVIVGAVRATREINEHERDSERKTRHGGRKGDPRGPRARANPHALASLRRSHPLPKRSFR